MSYQVIFTPEVDRDLVDLWVESEDQRAMTNAVDNLVRKLEANPLQVGESRDETRRVAMEFPVGIEFEVDEGLKEVHIYNLWTFQKRNE